MADKVKRYHDTGDALNGTKFRTGKLCIEDCGRPAGTYWSKLWCQPCNAKRMDRIDASFEKLRASIRATKPHPEPSDD